MQQVASGCVASLHGVILPNDHYRCFCPAVPFVITRTAGQLDSLLFHGQYGRRTIGFVLNPVRSIAESHARRQLCAFDA
jgi:hypothetical protein